MRAVTSTELLLETSISLGARPSGVRSSLVRAALRRAAYILAPCGRSDLLQYVASPLKPLGLEYDEIEDALDDLIVYGDILELHRLASDPWDAPAFILRPSPPCYVKRTNGDIILIGVSGDFSTPLTEELQARVEDDGRIRKLRPLPDEDLPEHLKLLGLSQLSEQSWLRAPPVEPPDFLAGRWRSALTGSAPISTNVNGLEVLDPNRPVTFYRGRWTVPTSSHTGIFVGRRPQEFGAPLWSAVQLQSGVPIRLIDIVKDDDKQRPCDLAWRLQMALDAERGTPQRLRVRLSGQVSHIDFFSPLPAFAERRLTLAGMKSTGSGFLYSFAMDADRMAAEVGALKSELWLEMVRERDA